MPKRRVRGRGGRCSGGSTPGSSAGVRSPVSLRSAGAELGREGRALLGQNDGFFPQEIPKSGGKQLLKHPRGVFPKLPGARWRRSGFPSPAAWLLAPLDLFLGDLKNPASLAGKGMGKTSPLLTLCPPHPNFCPRRRGSRRTASFGSASRRTATTPTPRPCTAAPARDGSGTWRSTSGAKPSGAAAPAPAPSTSPRTSCPASGSPSPPSSPSPSLSPKRSPRRRRNQRSPHPRLGKTPAPSSTG